MVVEGEGGGARVEVDGGEDEVCDSCAVGQEREEGDVGAVGVVVGLVVED